LIRVKALDETDAAVGHAAEIAAQARSLHGLRSAARDCRACPLWRRATRTVFGAGRSLGVMLVGEQPGHEEDLAGRPFVGPAGKVLDEALTAAGIDRDSVYVTNTVKHFKWQERDKRRLHQKPNTAETQACRPWLDAELRLVRPQVLICLGATAAQALLGRQFRVSVQRGSWIVSTLAPNVMATVHPASILRAPDPVARRRQLRQFIADLKIAARRISSLSRPGATAAPSARAKGSVA
jgi:uracil-DNA glycosylase family protein